MHVIIPMAGLGSRFADAGYKTHKPLIEVNGKTLIQHSVESLGMPDAHYSFIIREQGEEYSDQIKSALNKIGIEYILFTVNRLTSGAAETAMIAINGAMGHEPLIITNCDQYLDWDSSNFLKEVAKKKVDGALLTYDSTDPKNSFAEIVNGKVVRVVEKEAISNHALVGVHYWRDQFDFVEAAQELITSIDRTRESYISETYNYLIRDGKNIVAVPIEPGKYYSTGTPEDLAIFKGLQMEYFVPKPMTWFFDLDGTILPHAHRYSNLRNATELLPGVREALDELDSRGDTIVLTSSRPESARALTIEVLDRLMVPYDQLVLGISQGKRVIVNDKLDVNDPDRSGHFDVITDAGWTTEDLK